MKDLLFLYCSKSISSISSCQNKTALSPFFQKKCFCIFLGLRPLSFIASLLNIYTMINFHFLRPYVHGVKRIFRIKLPYVQELCYHGHLQLRKVSYQTALCPKILPTVYGVEGS